MAPAKKQTVKTVIEKKPATTEDLVLGNAPIETVRNVVSYEDPSIMYKVTNLKNDNVIECDGSLVETFIGSNNLAARQDLIDGVKSVITKDYNKKDEYKIEVVE